MSTKIKSLLFVILLTGSQTLLATNFTIVVPHQELVDIELGNETVLANEEIVDFSSLNPGSITTPKGKDFYRINLSEKGPIKSILLMNGMVIHAKSSGGEGGGY